MMKVNNNNKGKEMKVSIEINEEMISKELNEYGSRFDWLNDEGNKWYSEKVIEMIDKELGTNTNINWGKTISKMMIEYYGIVLDNDYEQTELGKRNKEERIKEWDDNNRRLEIGKYRKKNYNSNNKGVK